ncbi:IS66 family transposase [Pelagibaculum spongiae]|uniref:Transposase IS66 central domain-containing protein n=1 Tax=Pelagibaculum spongiae TaxID=2080658 RepID=A0A2V1GQW9_9GAMM|nr:transposase [Pelagibaculum spongiae]PVZ64462.1 hypothetical protein DC094_19290 [Pelagibaculum spongiae]
MPFNLSDVIETLRCISHARCKFKEAEKVQGKSKSDKPDKVAMALSYLNKNWKYLIRYCEDGHLEIDNNTAENTIRPFVIS